MGKINGRYEIRKGKEWLFDFYFEIEGKMTRFATYNAKTDKVEIRAKVLEYIEFGADLRQAIDHCRASYFTGNN